MNNLTSQLLLLEARLKRKQKQIASLLSHRELTIQRQKRIIDTLSSRLVDHGLETIAASSTELEDSDSAVVIEDDYESNLGTNINSATAAGAGEGITVARSISDAIETSLQKYGVVRRNNCFLRRPEILETVYSVEEDSEPVNSDLAEKRDKFRQRSEKAMRSSSSTEGQFDKLPLHNYASIEELEVPANIKENIPIVSVSSPPASAAAKEHEYASHFDSSEDKVAKTQVTNFNRVMSNHRTVTKPKDVKYKRINKAKSKSLEELRGRLKHLVEHGSGGNSFDCHYYNAISKTAHSYA